MIRIEIQCNTIPYGALPEVAVTTEKGLKNMAAKLSKPILCVKDAIAYDHRYPAAKIPLTKKHSLKCVISDGVIYKYVYDVAEENNQGESLKK